MAWKLSFRIPRTFGAGRPYTSWCAPSRRLGFNSSRLDQGSCFPLKTPRTSDLRSEARQGSLVQNLAISRVSLFIRLLGLSLLLRSCLRFCKRWEQGNCNFGPGPGRPRAPRRLRQSFPSLQGSACHFAHGERELRGRMPSQSDPKRGGGGRPRSEMQRSDLV